MKKILINIRLKLLSIRKNKFFESFVVSIIIISALNIGLSTFDINPNLMQALGILDYIITFFFLSEILIRMYSYEKVSQFFTKKWNIFDFIIVLFVLKFCFHASYSYRSYHLRLLKDRDRQVVLRYRTPACEIIRNGGLKIGGPPPKLNKGCSTTPQRSDH